MEPLEIPKNPRPHSRPYNHGNKWELPHSKGLAAHVYRINKSMDNRYLCNADGEMLFVPEQGAMIFVTEYGMLDAAPGEIVLIPRGVKFRADRLVKPLEAMFVKTTDRA